MFAAYTGSPRGRCIHNSKVILNTVWACSRFGKDMSSGRLTAFDLNKTFRANRLIATSGAVYVGWIVQEADRTLDSATIQLSFSSGRFFGNWAFGLCGIGSSLRVVCSCDRV